jgi:hypothetical protein
MFMGFEFGTTLFKTNRNDGTEQVCLSVTHLNYTQEEKVGILFAEQAIQFRI